MTSIAMKVESFLDSNGEEPRRRQPEQRDERSRSKSRTRRDQQPPQQIDVEDKWGYGEEINRRSDQIMKLLETARRELQETGTVSDDLPAILTSLQGGPELEKELSQVTELLASIPLIQRMTQIRTKIEQSQRGNLVDRFEKG